MPCSFKSYKAKAGYPFSGIIGRAFKDVLLSAFVGRASREALTDLPLMCRFILIMLAIFSDSITFGDRFSFISDGVLLITVEAGELLLYSEIGCDKSICLGLYRSPTIAFSCFSRRSWIFISLSSSILN